MVLYIIRVLCETIFFEHRKSKIGGKEQDMKLFGKELTVKEKKEMITRIILIILSGTVLIVSAVTTAAWFAHNTTVRSSGMQVVVNADNYKLLIQRTNEYDRVAGTPSEDVYPGISSLKGQLTEDGYDLVATKTSEAGALAFELFNEEIVENKRSLRPGSYGTLTFYIQTDESITVDFSLTLGGFANGYDNYENLIITEVSNQTYLNYLKGHLLFFTERSGATHDEYIYSGFINDGTFSYSTSEHTPQTVGSEPNCYPVILYWEWPLTYSEIIRNVSTTDSPQDNKYPTAMQTYLDEYTCFETNKSYFLAKNLTSTNSDALDDGYNDADQLIGDNISYIIAYIDIE